MDRPSGIPRPPASGIPRPSRLPKPASRVPAAVSRTTTPSSESSRGRLANVSTTAVSGPGTRPYPGRGSGSRQKKPEARSSTALSRTSTPDKDVLGDLEGFRTSSRASSRLDFGSVVDEDEEQDAPEFAGSGARKSSTTSTLAERTRESLQLLSSPPGGRKSRSGFFGEPDSPMGPPSRPASSMSSYSRPGTSMSSYRNNLHTRPTTPSMRASSNTRPPSSLRPPSAAATASGRRSASAATPRTSNIAGPKLRTPTASQDMGDPFQSPPASRIARNPVSGSKTMFGRVPKVRPAESDVSAEPSASPPRKAAVSQALRKPKSTPVTAKKVPQSSTEAPEDTDRKPSSSSAALREQIRAAKAARKAAAMKSEDGDEPANENQPSMETSSHGFDFGLDQKEEDPFNQQPKGGEAVMKRRIANARSDGNLNIANLGLKEIPPAVMTMYEFDPDSNFAWGETVDLARFNAADNKIEALPEDLFPDIDPPTDFDDEDARGPQFGGLERLDLHGNLLKQVPIGLRKLQMLTSLNLSRNQLSNGCFEVISQIPHLKDLKLAENHLDGELPESIEGLEDLETLDLRGNKISSLPSTTLQSLASLRICNLNGNRLGSVPMGAFDQTPLVELHVANNGLSGSFFPEDVEIYPRLQVLDLSGNSLTALGRGGLELPSLSSLNVSQNRITDMPDISAWTNLLSLQAGDNKLSELPAGFSTLSMLKHANFDGNSIRTLDPAIGLMERLETFSVAQNPLRERKFLTMSTDDLKRSLVARIQPAEHDEGAADGDPDADLSSPTGLTPTTSMWALGPSGTLDLSSRALSSLDEGEFATIAISVRQVLLAKNLFTSIPATMGLATSLTNLDLSSNRLTTAFEDPTSLLALRELRLRANNLTSISTITTNLSAPRLQTLDVSNNKLSGALPTLSTAFPELHTLHASDNGIDAVSADALRGLRVVNLGNNSIGRLDPEIGLLSGLTGLEVAGNTFRVPNHAVLSRGTEAVLKWLRDKVPKAEGEEDGETF